MGMEICAGSAELYGRAVGGLVTSWCDKFDRRDFSEFDWRERSGVVDYPAEIVSEANAAVPDDIEAARAAGFNVGDRPESFAAARRFLKAAASEPDGISGSY